MKVTEEYLEHALAFEQLAAAEIDPTLKVDFERQAVAYRKLAAERTKRLNLGALPQYRLHLLGRDGQFINGVILACADDAAAIEAAKRHADGYDIEVWDRSRKVATLPGIPK
jgi:hypothetical protein